MLERHPRSPDCRLHLLVLVSRKSTSISLRPLGAIASQRTATEDCSCRTGVANEELDVDCGASVLAFTSDFPSGILYSLQKVTRTITCISK